MVTPKDGGTRTRSDPPASTFETLYTVGVPADTNQRPPHRIRRGLIAAILSALCVGLGQIYNGQVRKGLLFFGAAALIFLSLFTLLAGSFQGFVAWIVIQLSIEVAALVDSARTAMGRTGAAPSRGIRAYVAAAAIVLADITLATSFLPKPKGLAWPYRAYVIPSNTMAPTLRAGDRIVADMGYYKHHRPQRGDLVIIVTPPFGDLTTKRVEAVAGGSVERNPKFHAGAPQFVKRYLGTAAQGAGAGGAPKGGTTEAVVPAGDIFVVGDNRSLSWDSRYYGFIGVDQIRGKPLYIYWSRDIARIGRAVR